MSKAQVLVTGASGQQGGAVAHALIAMGHQIRVMGRDATKLQHFADLGADVVEADFNDAKSLSKALKGISSAFLMTTWFEEGADSEVKQGINFIAAAKENHLQHLVYSSVGGADRAPDVPHFASKQEVEKYLIQSELRYTILRPVWFMENFGADWFLPSIKNGVLSTPLPADLPLQMVSLDVIGRFGALTITRPDLFVGETVELASEELTLEQAMKQLSEATGKKVQYVQMQASQAKELFGEEFAVMFDWFINEGYHSDLNQLSRWGVPLTKFTDYLKTAHWVKELSALPA